MNALTFVNDKNEKVTIEVSIYVDGYGSSNIKYRISDVIVVPERKRKGLSIKSLVRDEYQFRCLAYDKRWEYIKARYLEYCTEDQIRQAVQNAYESLKPNAENIEWTCL